MSGEYRYFLRFFQVFISVLVLLNIQSEPSQNSESEIDRGSSDCTRSSYQSYGQIGHGQGALIASQ